MVVAGYLPIQGIRGVKGGASSWVPHDTDPFGTPHITYWVPTAETLVPLTHHLLHDGVVVVHTWYTPWYSLHREWGVYGDTHHGTDTSWYWGVSIPSIIDPLNGSIPSPYPRYEVIASWVGTGRGP